ncbi:hypothetical protein [Methylobacterium sp.]
MAEALVPARDDHAHGVIVRGDGSRLQVELPSYMVEAFLNVADMFAERGQ